MLRCVAPIREDGRRPKETFFAPHRKKERGRGGAKEVGKFRPSFSSLLFPLSSFLTSSLPLSEGRQERLTLLISGDGGERFPNLYTKQK